MLRWRRCLRERTRMGTGSWTKRSGIGCSTLLAAEHPCEINNVLMMKMSFCIMLVKMTSKTIFVVHGNQIVLNAVVFRKTFAFLKFISAIAVVSIDAQRIKSDKNTWTDIVQNCFTRSLKSSTFGRPKMSQKWILEILIWHWYVSDCYVMTPGPRWRSFLPIWIATLTGSCLLPSSWERRRLSKRSVGTNVLGKLTLRLPEEIWTRNRRRKLKCSKKGFQVDGHRRGWHCHKRGNILKSKF